MRTDSSPALLVRDPGSAGVLWSLIAVEARAWVHHWVRAELWFLTNRICNRGGQLTGSWDVCSQPFFSHADTPCWPLDPEPTQCKNYRPRQCVGPVVLVGFLAKPSFVRAQHKGLLIRPGYKRGLCNGSSGSSYACVGSGSNGSSYICVTMSRSPAVMHVTPALEGFGSNPAGAVSRKGFLHTGLCAYI